MSRLWMRLDNAALIFPAVRRREWVNCFRVSATIKDDIDPVLLQRAVDDLKPRFPSMYVRLGSGIFWYFLEEVDRPPQVREDYAYPLTHMGSRELHTCAFRVLYYKNRIAVEIFHSLTDGTGGSIYLKTLAARYVELRYGVEVPAENGVLDYRDSPTPEELEDSFLKYSGKFSMSRSERNSWRLRGTRVPDNFLHVITGIVDTDELLAVAHGYGCTVTAFLSAVMAETIIGMQAEKVPLKSQKPVKISVAVNLRKLFPSKTLRNFALVLNPGVDPRLGEYTLAELCREFSHQLAGENTRQKMAARIAANVKTQQTIALRLAPLFLKNLALKMVYDSVGEKKGCLNISNLGPILMPEIMSEFVSRIEFIIGVQISYFNNCSVATYGNTTCINMIRSIKETELERRFFSRLVELGVAVTIESN